MQSRAFAYLVSATLIALVLYPLRFERGRDSFPLSNYPMFARAQTSPVMSLHYMLGYSSGGDRTYLRPELLGTSEVLQARAVIASAARRGHAGSMELCRRVASRVADDRESVGIEIVQVIYGRHDAVAFLADKEIGEERVLARCPVER